MGSEAKGAIKFSPNIFGLNIWVRVGYLYLYVGGVVLAETVNENFTLDVSCCRCLEKSKKFKLAFGYADYSHRAAAMSPALMGSCGHLAPTSGQSYPNLTHSPLLSEARSSIPNSISI